MENTIDIDSRKKGAAGRLSNLTERNFFFCGVPCRAIEGPLQAFKYPDLVIQRKICMMNGREAQKKGQEMNDSWKSQQILWWQGRKYPRESKDYQRLLDDLYDQVFKLPDFQEDLLSTGNAELIHTIGKEDPADTVLTVHEFCSRLMSERERLRRSKGILTIQEMNDAVKKIEIDGMEAFNSVKEMYGEQVATLLSIAHLRKKHGSFGKYPPDPTLDEYILNVFWRP